MFVTSRPHPHQIPARLNELDHEWDIERTLEANAAPVGLAGVLLGAFVDRRLLVFPAAVMAFLLQHAVQGWCPPVPFFRSRGMRTASEIDKERYVLKALRGDFAKMPAAPAASGWAAASAAAERKAQQAIEATRAWLKGLEIDLAVVDVGSFLVPGATSFGSSPELSPSRSSCGYQHREITR